MSNPQGWSVTVCGCGTVGYAVAHEVAHEVASHRTEGLRRVTLVDKALVRENSLITCPRYAGNVGLSKSAVLAELVRRLLPSGVAIDALVQEVESLEWPPLLADARGLPIVVVGLDDWNGRVAVVEDIRQAAPWLRVPPVIVQVGLDLGAASVCVFGPAWDDACPACGLAALPQEASCVAFTDSGCLLRGDLQPEARAAARLVAEIIAGCVAGRPADWPPGTKMNLVADAGGAFRRMTRRRARVPGCLGPHSPDVPERWDSRRAQ